MRAIKDYARTRTHCTNSVVFSLVKLLVPRGPHMIKTEGAEN